MEEEQKTPKHKGGRPPKKVKRCRYLMVRLTETERFFIEQKAKEAGMKPSEWLRHAAKKAKVIARLSTEDAKVLRLFAGAANNINQIAKHAHTQGLMTIYRKCMEVLSEADDFLKYLNDDGENSRAGKEL